MTLRPRSDATTFIPAGQAPVPMPKRFPDIQSKAPENPYPLSRVGVSGVRKPVMIRRPGGHEFTYVLTFEVGVDLPAEQKGSHLSRNVEVIAEIVDESVRTPTEGIEYLCAEICRRLLDRHGYAGWAECRASCDHFGTRDGQAMRYGLAGIAVGERGKPIRKRLVVIVPGFRGGGDEIRLTLDLPDGKDVEARNLITAIEGPLRNATSLPLALAGARAGLATVLRGLPPAGAVEIDGSWPDPACVITARWSGTVEELGSPAAKAGRPTSRSQPPVEDDSLDFDVENTLSG